MKHPVHNTVIATYRALRVLELGLSRLLLYARRSNCTVARRNLHDHRRTQPPQHLAAGGAVLASGVSGLLLPARAEGLAPTPSMAGGANNYRQGAPIVDRIGKGGFWMTGTVRRAGDGAPLAGQRVQIWAHTTEGQEHEPQSHGATFTDKNGAFRLEMPQIIPVFGQPHGHLAYDSGEFKTVFLRPVMRSAKETSLEAHFVLQSA